MEKSIACPLTLAEVPVERICVEWRWTNAFSRLYTFFIGLALVVIGASLLGWGTEPVVRITSVSTWTYALIRALFVDTLRSVSANLMTFYTLVYIYKENCRDYV